MFTKYSWPASCAVVFGLSVCQGSLLIAHDHVSASSVAPFTAPDGLKFLIEFRPPGVLEYFGNDMYWSDGDTGTIDFTSANTSDFALFASWITNGLDDEVVFMTFNQFGDGAGSGGFESEIGLGSPDLVGNQIDLIRLVVNNLSIQPYTLPSIGNGLQWEAHLTWEFWGTPVPEPTTGVFFAAALSIALLNRRIRISKRHQSIILS